MNLNFLLNNIEFVYLQNFTFYLIISLNFVKKWYKQNF